MPSNDDDLPWLYKKYFNALDDSVIIRLSGQEWVLRIVGMTPTVEYELSRPDKGGGSFASALGIQKRVQ